MDDEQLIDALTCQHPQAVWETMVQTLKNRASASRETAISLEREAKDALKQCNEHYEAETMFLSLARALEKAPVEFPAPPQSIGMKDKA